MRRFIFMSLCLKLVVGNALNYTKISSLILQLNRPETVSKRQCFSHFGTKVLQKILFSCCFLQNSNHVVTTRLFIFIRDNERFKTNLSCNAFSLLDKCWNNIDCRLSRWFIGGKDFKLRINRNSSTWWKKDIIKC